MQLCSKTELTATSTLLSQFASGDDICVQFHWVFPATAGFPGVNSGMRRITTFRSTTDPIHTYQCVTTAYSIQYSNMLYRFVAYQQLAIPYRLFVQ